MSEKVACSGCGALILATTAAANGGVCMPCKKGIRRSLEDGKRRAAERKLAREYPDPAALHWRWLVDQVWRTPGGFTALSPENQIYFAVCMLEGEVYNGGFDQYFSNSSGDHFDAALHGLEVMDAKECRRLLLAAKDLLFGSADVPPAQADRHQHMTRARERKLDELDRKFGAEAVALRESLSQYAREHGLFPSHDR